MPLSLESLELSPAELERCHDAVRRMAYLKWIDAGRPPGDGLRFWLEAEREWIEHNYVPNRLRPGHQFPPSG